ncbi:MAG: glycosyltransferase family 4 protein [Candidatus Omnitrophota bacterium]
MKRTVLIWPDFNFYHLARFRALYKKLGKNLLGIEFIGGEGDDHTTQWRYEDRDKMPITTLFPESDFSQLNRRRVGEAAVKELISWGADTIFVNGYSRPELRVIINWAYKNNKRCFTFFETKEDDFRRFFWKEWAKKAIIKKLDGAICGGILHKKYLMKLGMPEDRIYFGYDVVDNDFFKEKSRQARLNSRQNREKYKLPDNYFLTVARFVKKKNLLRLIDAYKLYSEKAGQKYSWHLILCGAGPQEEKIIKKIKKEKIKNIHIAGSKNPEELAIYYGLANCFILPSTREQWGLTVNEAMASGLPVLVTKVAGVVPEVVEEGVNGYTFNPFSVEDIAEYMLKISSFDNEKLIQMGKNAENRISTFTPKYFAENIIKLI